MAMAGIPLLTFSEARDHFRGLIPMTDVEWEQATEEIRNRAFTLANVASSDVIVDVHNLLDKRFSEGMTFQEFQQEALKVFEDKGWIGPDLNRLATIFDTNIQTGYGYGRFKQHSDMADLYPYGEYATVGDNRVREDHRPLNGQIHLMSSEFWQIHYPPWAYRCRCSCIPRTREEVEGAGVDVSYDSGPPAGDFQNPSYGLSFGDPDLAIKQLMEGSPQWAKTQVRSVLEDPAAIAHSKALFDN